MKYHEDILVENMKINYKPKIKGATVTSFLSFQIINERNVN